MRAGVIAARYERILAVGYLCKRIKNTAAVLHACRIVRRAAQHKVVIHEAQTLGIKAVQNVGKAFVHESLLLSLVAVLLLKNGEDIVKQSGVLDGGRGGKADHSVFVGGICDLIVVLRRIVLEVKEIITVLLNTVFLNEFACLGEHPVNERFRAVGVNFDVGNGVAVGIGKRCVRINGKQRVCIDHILVRFHEYAGIDV